MPQTISILGGGWLGIPLAHALQARGHAVRVSTTQARKAEVLAQQGINACVLALHPEPEGVPLAEFLTADAVVICIPPKIAQKGVDFHRQQVAHVVAALPHSTPLLYTGSTGVFAAHAGETVDEDTPPRLEGDRPQALGHAEAWLQEAVGSRLALLRLGGLMGYDRIPGRMASTKPLKGPDQRVNFVHRDDAVGIMMSIISQAAYGKIFHAVAPLPATRKAVYTAAAQMGGWKVSDFQSFDGSLGHIVEGRKTQQFLAYDYHFPDPTRFHYHIS